LQLQVLPEITDIFPGNAKVDFCQVTLVTFLSQSLNVTSLMDDPWFFSRLISFAFLSSLLPLSPNLRVNDWWLFSSSFFGSFSSKKNSPFGDLPLRKSCWLSLTLLLQLFLIYLKQGGNPIKNLILEKTKFVFDGVLEHLGYDHVISLKEASILSYTPSKNED